MSIMEKALAIIPAYNEEASIEKTVEELKRVAPSFDFVVINDGSSDRTKDLCLENGYPLIDLPVNGGLSAAFQTGMKYALRRGYDYAVQFDADGQHMPEFLSEMLSLMKRDGADIVIGSRFVERSKHWSLRMMGSRVISFITKLTTGKTIYDPTSGLRLFNRTMIERFAKDNTLNPEPESIAYLMRKGAKVAELQVEMREREAGESYLSLPKSIGYMVRACTSILFVQWFRG